MAKIEILQRNLVQKFNGTTTVDHLTSSRHIVNTMLGVRLFSNQLEIILIVCNHISASLGQSLIGRFVF